MHWIKFINNYRAVYFFFFLFDLDLIWICILLLPDLWITWNLICFWNCLILTLVPDWRFWLSFYSESWFTGFEFENFQTGNVFDQATTYQWFSMVLNLKTSHFNHISSTYPLQTVTTVIQNHPTATKQTFNHFCFSHKCRRQ